MQYRILLVENEEDIRSDDRKNLISWGYEVVEAKGTGEALVADALSLATRVEAKPDLALVDMRLIDDDDPNDISGLKLAGTLKPLPCIIITNHISSRMMRRSFVDYQVRNFIARSQGPSEIKNAIERLHAEIQTRRILSPHRVRAILVGVNHYVDAHISNLHVCDADVTAVGQMLRQYNYTVRLLTDSTYEQLPCVSSIFAELSQIALAAEHDDLILFYFSGHGFVTAERSYLLPRDVRLAALKHTSISVGAVREIMDASPARAKVIILDACHSGASIGTAKSIMTEEFIRCVFEEAKGIAVLSSCEQGQQSWEWPEQGHSVFTYYLLEALTGRADFDNKGFVTISDVNRYVSDGVRRWAAEHGVPQTPTLQASVAGDIVLVQHK